MADLIHTPDVSADITKQADALLAAKREQEAKEEAQKPATKRTSRTPKAEAPAPQAKGAKGGKEAEKPQAKGKGRTTRKAPQPKGVNYVIQDFARPRGGHNLAAFTAAWFELLGILDGQAYPRAKIAQIAGDTAVNYHTKNGNFERTEKGLVITPKGQAFFAARAEAGGVDPQVKEAYMAMMQNGEIDGALVKNPIGIKKIA